VIGEQSGSTITASQVSSVYLGPVVRARAKAGRLARGDQFSAEIWDDPKTGRPAAFIFRTGGS
jgi:hypothetical protein